MTVRDAGFAVALSFATVACGTRSELYAFASVSDAAPPSADGPSCQVPPSCPSEESGTWRLLAADGATSGYLFMYDDRGACGGTANGFLLQEGPLDAGCSRNGDYTVEANTAQLFEFTCNNLGGSDNPPCGSLPFSESIDLTLVRDLCSSDRYELHVRDNQRDAPFDFSANAVRCRCDIGWQPCVEPYPADPCAP